jgi:hypothetical protein
VHCRTVDEYKRQCRAPNAASPCGKDSGHAANERHQPRAARGATTCACAGRACGANCGLSADVHEVVADGDPEAFQRVVQALQAHPWDEHA